MQHTYSNITDKSCSCYSARDLIRYAQKNGICMDDFRLSAKTCWHILVSEDRWISAKEWSNLVSYISERYNKPVEEIGYEIVKDANSKLTFRLWIFQAIPFSAIKKLCLVDKIVKKFINKNIHGHIQILTDNHMQLIFNVLDQSIYFPQICDFNKGCIRAIFEVKGYKNVTLTESECALVSDSGDKCIYDIHWDFVDKSDTPKKALEKIKAEDHEAIPVSFEDMENFFKE